MVVCNFTQSMLSHGKKRKGEREEERGRERETETEGERGIERERESSRQQYIKAQLQPRPLLQCVEIN